MKDFLLEIGVEELPARFISPGVEQLRSLLCQALEETRIEYGEVTVYSTPRRLAVLIRDLAEAQTDLEQDIKGPPVKIAFDDAGELTKAGLGFARSQGAAPSDLQRKELNGADYLFVHRFVPGSPTIDVLPSLVEKIVPGISFPKNMRWGSYDLRYARPVRWLTVLFGSDVLPVAVENVIAGAWTYGHRQLHPQPIRINQPGQYLELLRNGFVLADFEARRAIVRDQVETAAAKHGGLAQIDSDLLDEVSNLVEYPTAFVGQFDRSYLQVPNEVLVTSMKEHQRYFPVRAEDGGLMPLFIGVRNGTDFALETVIQGNEKVLTARLSDAKFFFDEDRKKTLEELADKLQYVVFQDGLGTMADKVRRIEELSVRIAEAMGWKDQVHTISRTAVLAKADLVSQMVYEFPELQGSMGKSYALFQGEENNVARGIAEHYMPKASGGQLPETKEGIAVSLADKMDTLAGYFSLGRIPTGSQDPFALRRQALGVVQILEAIGSSLSLETLCQWSLIGYGDSMTSQADDVIASLLEFFLQRMRALLLDKGLRYDTVDAVLATREWRTAKVFEKAAALAEFRLDPSFAQLYTVLERAANLGNKGQTMDIDSSVLTEADNDLLRSIEQVEISAESCWQQSDWLGYLRTMATLEVPVARFFDAVMVMDKDETLRSNRLALLKRVAALGQRYADFRQIVSES